MSGSSHNWRASVYCLTPYRAAMSLAVAALTSQTANTRQCEEPDAAAAAPLPAVPSPRIPSLIGSSATFKRPLPDLAIKRPHVVDTNSASDETPTRAYAKFFKMEAAIFLNSNVGCVVDRWSLAR